LQYLPPIGVVNRFGQVQHQPGVVSPEHAHRAQIAFTDIERILAQTIGGGPATWNAIRGGFSTAVGGWIELPFGLGP
jgi:hypothetical protein